MVMCADVLSHPSVKSLPQFSSTYNEFLAFLQATKSDLESKKLSLENEREKLKQAKGLAPRRMRNYISCQLFMLSKHASRLEGFEAEVASRLSSVLAEDESSRENDPPRTAIEVETGVSLAGLDIHEDEPALLRRDSLPEIQVDEVDGQHSIELSKTEMTNQPDAISCHSDESSCPSSECGSVNYRISSGNDDSFDSSISTASSSNGSPSKESTESTKVVPSVPSTASSNGESPKHQLTSTDMKLIKLSADMKKMKRRVKHILDVTDRYCSLRPVETTEPDGMTIALPDGSRPATPDLRSPGSSALPDPISQHLMRTTFQSLGNHLAVIAKTYTRRHSSELDVAKEVKSPTAVSP